jgi:hypothetical protein
MSGESLFTDEFKQHLLDTVVHININNNNDILKEIKTGSLTRRLLICGKSRCIIDEYNYIKKVTPILQQLGKSIRYTPQTQNIFYGYRALNLCNLKDELVIGACFSQPIPFSISWNTKLQLDGSIPWLFKSCCLFRLKIPYSYPFIPLSLPDALGSYHLTKELINQDQYELIIPPSRFYIDEIDTRSNNGKEYLLVTVSLTEIDPVFTNEINDTNRGYIKFPQNTIELSIPDRDDKCPSDYKRQKR